MTSCVIFGGAGYIGTHVARRFLKEDRFEHVHIADIRSCNVADDPRITFSITDVRKTIPANLTSVPVDWIFNFAAVHRDPGHAPHEYFDTNLAGARNVCAYAESAGCENIMFSSSISVYGPTPGPTDETMPVCPVTPYGSSKYASELIHETWACARENRRLITVRPGVIYGPGDPGNILRMIRAIKRGYFAYPGSPAIRKSYGYIAGLIDSIEFMLDKDDKRICYNYVEHPTESLEDIVGHVKIFLNSRAPVLPLPMSILLPAAIVMSTLLGKRNPIHPTRVRKVATATHIIPAELIRREFQFRYDFASSLQHWRQNSPEDFGVASNSTGDGSTSRR